MNMWREVLGGSFWLAVGVMAIAVAGSPGISGAVEVVLSGREEVPPVVTRAAGKGNITIGDDKAVSGSVTTTGVVGTAAHIHQGAPGKNGPVIVPLTKNGNTYTVPAGTKLTDDQYKAYKAGELYVNVHSIANKDGEIRGQIKP